MNNLGRAKGNTFSDRMNTARLRGTLNSELSAAIEECEDDPEKYFLLIKNLRRISGDWWIQDENAIYLYLIDRVMDYAKEKLQSRAYSRLYQMVSGEFWMI